MNYLRKTLTLFAVISVSVIATACVVFSGCGDSPAKKEYQEKLRAEALEVSKWRKLEALPAPTNLSDWPGGFTDAYYYWPVVINGEDFYRVVDISSTPTTTLAPDKKVRQKLDSIFTKLDEIAAAQDMVLLNEHYNLAQLSKKLDKMDRLLKHLKDSCACGTGKTILP